MNSVKTPSKTITITPPSGWQLIDFEELREYRDLLYFLVRRDVRALYAQTVMGLSWAILRPLIQIALFTLVFGRIAGVPTDGIPYLLFAAVAVIPWTYMATAMSDSSLSLVTNAAMLGKVYFPRMIYPLTAILAKIIDLAVSFVIIVALLIVYRIAPTANLLLLPLFLVMTIIVPVGIGLWLSSLALRFRDVKFAMPFFVQMAMYTAPIVYSIDSIPERYRFWYSLNPIVGPIQGFRASLLGLPVDWSTIVPSAVIALIILVTGALYFRRMERVLVDVI